jgi:protein-S-isoprenylcysteine O-methyltransferase Ste14
MEQLPLLLGWCAYAFVHSLLASLALKAAVTRNWPGIAPWYRLGYNLFAAVSALPLVWLFYTVPGDNLWAWRGIWAWLGNGLALAAVAGVMISSRSYDMDEFLGLRQIRARVCDATADDGFRISPLHRFVRHPWYSFGLVIVWTRDMNEAMLVSALAITLYFVIGSRFEERKLIALHGDSYSRYRKRVPGLLPLPWKFLGRDEAATFADAEDRAALP